MAADDEEEDHHPKKPQAQGSSSSSWENISGFGHATAAAARDVGRIVRPVANVIRREGPDALGLAADIFTGVAGGAMQVVGGIAGAIRARTVAPGAPDEPPSSDPDDEPAPSEHAPSEAASSSRRQPSEAPSHSSSAGPSDQPPSAVPAFMQPARRSSYRGTSSTADPNFVGGGRRPSRADNSHRGRGTMWY